MIPQLQDLEDALDAAAKETLAGAPPAAKREALERLARCQNKFDAVKYHAMWAFEATQEHRVEGQVSPTAWLKSHAREEGRDAARWTRVSRYLKSMPLADRALSEGLITTSHVELLHRAQRAVGDDAFAIAEEALVDAAVAHRFSDFARTVEYFCVRAAPADADERARRNAEDRYASSSRTFGGNGVVDAQLEPVGFTIWQAELDRLVNWLLEQDRAEATARLGRRPLPSELGRTPRQRRVDAMVLMAQRSADHQGDGLGRSTFTLIVHGDAELVARLITFVRDEIAKADPDDPNPPEPDLSRFEYGPRSLHELDDGTVITVNTLILALLTGVVRGLLYDPDGVPLRFGHEQRIFNDDQAMVGRALYRRCCHPYGCDSTAPWLQSDHRIEWKDGGPTDADNLQTLDGGHNIWKTNHKGDPPPENPDRGQRRLPPVTGPHPQPP